MCRHLPAVRPHGLAVDLVVGRPALAGHRDFLFAEATGFGLACAAMLVVSPVARNHYFVLLAPAVLFVPLGLTAQASLPARVLAVVPGVLIVVQHVLLPYVGRIGLLGLGTTGWLMAATLLIVSSGASADESAALPDVSAAPVTETLRFQNDVTVCETIPRFHIGGLSPKWNGVRAPRR